MDLMSGGYFLVIVAVARAIEAVSKLFWNKHNKRKYDGTVNDRRKNFNRNDKPGKAKECIKHVEKIGKIETKVKMLCETNTREHGELRAYVREKFDDVLTRLDK